MQSHSAVILRAGDDELLGWAFAQGRPITDIPDETG